MDVTRDFIKLIRDKAKSKYTKDSNCRICSSNEDLELHHYYSLAHLVEIWLKKNNLQVPKTIEEVESYRMSFIEKYKKELYDEVVTLCKQHHQYTLHKIYGKVPPLHTAKKQKRWVEIQREKHLDGIKKLAD